MVAEGWLSLRRKEKRRVGGKQQLKGEMDCRNGTARLQGLRLLLVDNI